MNNLKIIKHKEIALRDENNPVVFLDLSIGEEKVGRVIIELYKHAVPSTAKNFHALCTGEVESKDIGKFLHYKGSYFHKLMPHFMYQGGDIVNFDGSSGYSIYGPEFELENFIVPHDEPGVLSMVTLRETFCNSQFIITSTECPHLNGRCVAFGRVIKGFSCIQQMSEVKTVNDSPQVPCMIRDCGELKQGDDYQCCNDDGTGDDLPHGPEDLEIVYENNAVNDLIEIVNIIVRSAKYHYQHKAYIDSHRKFQKVIRYITWIESKVTTLELGSHEESELYTRLADVRHTTFLNLSGTTLQLDEPKQCIQFCDKVLATEQNNIKALYRKGKAFFSLKDYNEALRIQTQALALKPNDSSINAEIKAICKKRSLYLAEEKKVFCKMFDFRK